MRNVRNERGSATIYLLWLTTVMIVLTIIIVNIARVYIVKQQASTAAQLGAFAATSEILIATEDAVKDFDEAMIEALEEGEVYDPLWDEIEDRKEDYILAGDTEQEAYIKALNSILPGNLGNPLLKHFFDLKFSTLSTSIFHSVSEVIKENEGNEEHLEIVISKEKYRVEVKTDATYNALTDGKYINAFSEDIPQKGYGPQLTYLKYVLN